MAILGFMYAQDLLTNNYMAVADKIPNGRVKPGVLAMRVSEGNGAWRKENFFTKFMIKVADVATMRWFPGYGSQNPRDGFWSEIPAESSELWFRLYQKMSIPATVYNYLESDAEQVLIEFWNWNGVRMKKVADIIVPRSGGNGLVQYRLLADTEGADTVTRTHSLGSLTSFTNFDPATNEGVYDFRFKLDELAGFIQIYDYTMTCKTEVLGPNKNSLAITHATVFPRRLCTYGPLTAQPLFHILANEPTFGMYVMPMRAKAEGSYQQQVTGGYQQFNKNYVEYANRFMPILKKETEDTVKYSYIPQNATDCGLPANYNVLAVEYKAAIDTTKSGLGDLTVNGFMKFIDSGQEFSKPLLLRQANESSIANQVPQVSALRWDKNPVTGQNWQPGDLANIELGISL